MKWRSDFSCTSIVLILYKVLAEMRSYHSRIFFLEALIVKSSIFSLQKERLALYITQEYAEDNGTCTVLLMGNHREIMVEMGFGLGIF